jgi:hypothetical protein
MSKTNFPHPVLGLSNDYNKTSQISLEWNVDDSGTNKDGMIFWVDLRYNLNNEGILELLKNNKAKAFCEISCTNTLFSESFEIDMTGIFYETKQVNVFGKIDFTVKIVVSEDIKNISFTDLNEIFYLNEIFNVEKNDIIAQSLPVSTTFEPSYIEDTLLEEKSLFKYKRHISPNAETDVQLTETRIEIWFSHQDFKAYQYFYGSDKLNLNSMLIAFPILCMVVQRRLDKKLSPTWERAIQQAIQEFNITDDSPQISSVFKGVRKIMNRKDVNYLTAKEDVSGS